MNSIELYLDSIFKDFPKTDRIALIKKDLLLSMEEKFNELIREGKSQRKASEIVISEFGNIDELKSEFGISEIYDNDINYKNKVLTEDELKGYLKSNKKYSINVSTGTSLCIIGAALMVLWYHLVEIGILSVTSSIRDIGGIIIILGFVAVAVTIFIVAGVKQEKYRYITKKKVTLPSSLKIDLEREIKDFHHKYILGLVGGTLTCVLSPIILIVAQGINPEWIIYAVVLFLFVIAIAVYYLVYFSIINEGYKKLNR